MASFPLGDLNSDNLVKVINKLKEASYFRLQQTCRGIGDFIGNNPNIAVHVDRWIYPRWDEESSYYIFGGFIITGYDFKTLYGTRLSFMEPYWDEDVKRLCAFLMKYRITCMNLSIYQVEWTNEECVKVLNTVKPTMTNLNSANSDRFKALLDCKGLRKVVLQVSGEKDFAVMAPEVLSKFEDVTIRLQGSEHINPLDLIRGFLNNICSYKESVVTLTRYSCVSYVKWDPVFSTDDVKQVVVAYNLKIADNISENDRVTYIIELPQRFPLTANLSISIKIGEYVDILEIQYNS